MSAVAILTSARARIADSTSWTKSSYARDAAGEPVRSDAPEAVCWCAYGALDYDRDVFPSGVGAVALITLQRAARRVHGEAVTTVNDVLGHAAVLAMYDDAIALAAAEAGGV